MKPLVSYARRHLKRNKEPPMIFGAGGHQPERLGTTGVIFIQEKNLEKQPVTIALKWDWEY